MLERHGVGTWDTGKRRKWRKGAWSILMHCLESRACDAEAIREPYEDMISRVSSFGRYLSLGLDGIELIAYSKSICKNEKDGNHDVRAFDEEAFAENPRFDLKQLPVVEKLFENPKFLKFAKSVCPKEKQILDWRDTGFGTICVVGPMGQDLDVESTWGKALYITTVVLCAVPGSFPVQLHPFRARTNCSTPLGCTILFGCHSFSSPTVAATGQKCACVPKNLLFEVRSISLPYW